MDLDIAAKRYIEAARLHGEASEAGDSESANSHFDVLIDALRQLRRCSQGGNSALRGMLQHENPHVRCWAATHLLAVDPSEAIRALEVLSARSDLAGFNASIVLAEWRKGTLQVS
jgi:hypothetical protein